MLTYDVLSHALKNEYGCSFIEELHLPYQDQEDAPKYWRAPCGMAFTVPLPDNQDGTYSNGVLNRMFQKLALKKVAAKSHLAASA